MFFTCCTGDYINRSVRVFFAGLQFFRSAVGMIMAGEYDINS
ncbi:hypothetical protein J2Y03_002288 [Neobacillus niacini]|nr:hypothetical protein [Neobacillus niacini]